CRSTNSGLLDLSAYRIGVADWAREKTEVGLKSHTALLGGHRMLIRATGVTVAIICLGATTFATPSWAVPVTYNLTLTQTLAGNLVPTGPGPSSIAGSGSLTVEGPVPAVGQVAFTEPLGLLALSFLIDGHTFDLSDAGPATVTFLNGSLTGPGAGFNYTGVEGGNLFSLQVSDTYNYFGNVTPFRQSIGTFTATLAPAVPEPSTLSLIGLGLLGVGAMKRRRRVLA